MIATTGQVKICCVHEVSHFAVAHSLGLSCESVRVHCTPVDVGRMVYDCRSDRLIREGKVWGSYAMVALGGLLGQWMYQAGSVDPATCFGNFDSPMGDVRQAVEAVEKLNPPDKLDLLRRSSITAHGHLLRNWASVLALSTWLVNNSLCASGVTAARFFSRNS